MKKPRFSNGKTIILRVPGVEVEVKNRSKFDQKANLRARRVLGRLWGRLGGVLGRLGGCLGASWARLAGILGRLRRVLERPGRVLGASWRVLRACSLVDRVSIDFWLQLRPLEPSKFVFFPSRKLKFLQEIATWS